jgi:type 1 glutamine amidotransferase
MKNLITSLFLIFSITFAISASSPSKSIRILASLGPEIAYEIAEFPKAYDMFLPENRDKYDVLVFYHMWQKITDEQAKVFSECISEGKPVVALHHSICAFDEWPEYWNIIGG